MPFLQLCMSLQEDTVVDACRQFLLIMRHHNHGLVVALAESLDDILHQTAVVIVETMQWLIQNQKLRIFYESTGQENQALFAT